MLRWISVLIAGCSLVAVAALDITKDLTITAHAADVAPDMADCITRDAAIRTASHYVARQGGAGIARGIDAAWSDARWTVFFWDGEDAARAPVWVGVSADGEIAGCDAGGACALASMTSVSACGITGRAAVSQEEAEKIARAFLAQRIPGHASRHSLALWSESSWMVFFETAAAGTGANFIVEVSPRGDIAGAPSGI